MFHLICIGRKWPLLLAASAMCLASVATASATGSIECTATDGSGAGISVSIGRLPVLQVLGAAATDGSTIWSTQAGAGEQIVFGDGSSFDGETRIVFTDPNVETRLVILNLFSASVGTSWAEAGVLVIHSVGVYPVMCEEG